MKFSPRPLLLAAALCLGSTAHAASNVAITEWMYNGSEFIEFTNLSGAAIDLSGWSFDDDSRTAGTVSLSDFGTLAAGETVILAEDDAATFRTKWSLASGVKVIDLSGPSIRSWIHCLASGSEMCMNSTPTVEQ